MKKKIVLKNTLYTKEKKAQEVGPPEPDQGRRVRRPPPPQGERRLPLQGVIGWSFLQILLKVYFLLHFGLYSKYSLYEKTLQNI